MTKAKQWVEGWGESPKKKQAQVNLEQAAQKTVERRNAIKSGNDIALKNVKTPIIKKAGQAIGNVGLGAAIGASKLGATAADIALLPADIVNTQIGLKGWEPMHRTQNYDAQTKAALAPVKNALNTDNRFVNKAAYGIGEFIPAIALSGGITKAVQLAPKGAGLLNKGVSIADEVANTAGIAQKALGGKVAGKAASALIKTTPDMLNTYAMMELPKPESERTPLPEWAAMWGATELGMKGAGAGVKSLLKKTKVEPKAEVKADEADDFFDLEGDRGIDFTADQFGNVRRGEALEALPAGKQRLALQAGQTPKALTGQQPLMLKQGVDHAFYESPRFRVGPDGKAMDMEQGSFPLAKVEGVDYTTNTGLKGRQRIAQDIDQTVPRSDIGDPQYLASLENQYNQLVNNEVALLKEGTGSKPIQGGLVFDSEGNVINRYGRTSNNAEWYQNFWKENNRPPNEGEIRDVAIKNLIEGDQFTGRGASDEFHALLSELSRGQKLPEEWHGLQQSIRELEGATDNGFEAFKGGTKVVDGQGSPLIVYHGTRNIDSPLFNKSDKESIDQYGRGVYFTENKNYANMYSYGNPNAGVIEAYLDIQKPYDVTKTWANKEEMLADPQVQKVLTYMDSIGKGDWMMANLKPNGFGKLPTADKIYGNIDWLDQQMGRGKSNEGLKQAGFDGIISEGLLDGVLSKHYIVFKPDQVRKINPEISSLLSDMKAAQKQVEPYGLNKNLDRLTELENQARQRMKDRADFRKQYPDAIGIVARNPLDDIKDLTIIGASKIAKGTIEFAQWSKEMIDEFGQIIEKQLPGIWKHSNILVQKGETVLKYKGNEMPVKWQAENATPKAGKLPGVTNGQATPQNIVTGAGEANAVNDISKQIAGLKNHINNAKKATKYDGNEPARAARVAELEGQLKGLMKTAATNKTGYNDISGFQAETQDVARNFKDFYGKDVELEEGSILDRLNTAKGSNVDYQQNWTDKLKSEVVDKLGINKNTALSKLVQQYGEGEITLAQLKTMRPRDWSKVVEADSWFRKAYDEILTDVNKTIEQIYPGQADKLVPKRSDYYRHFRDLEGFQGFKNMIGSPANISPELAGRSEFVKPNTKWASFKQQRGLGEFKRDAVGGFLDYLPAASYSVNIDPMVGQFRGLSDQLVKETSGEANTMIRYLQDYANSLAGKTSGWDRKFQELLEGRGGSRLAMNTITWLNNRAKANSVLLNPGSALSQVLNIPNGVAFAKQYSIPGTGKALLNIFKEDPARASSAFMKERFSGQMYRQFDTKWFNQPKNFASWMIETADRLGTEMIWQSCHSKGLKTPGIADPVKYADAMTKRLVAGRGIGEMALIQKSKLFQVVAPFQVEVGNLWKVQKDFIKEKDFGAIATLYVGLWMANNMMESVRGQRIVFDPINAIIEATQEIMDPENNAKEKAYKAGGRLAGEILGNVPLGQTMAAAYPEYGNSAKGIPTRKELFGSEDPTRYGTGPLIVKAVQNPLKYLALPFGGAQADKVWQSGKALLNEGSYKNDKLRYPVNVDTESVSKGMLFGPSAMDETKEYYNKDRRPLSENQTKEYQAMVRSGMTPEKAYERIMKAREERSKKKGAAAEKAPEKQWKAGW